MKKVDIYACCTPYSFLIAYTLASKSNNVNILVLKEDFDITWILEALDNARENIFSNIYTLKRTHVASLSKYSFIKNIIYNRVVLRNISRKYKVDKTYIPNPYVSEFTVLTEMGSKKILYEEGIGLQKDCEYPYKPGILIRGIKKILFGLRYREVIKSPEMLDYFDEYLLSNNCFSSHLLPVKNKNFIKLDLKDIFKSFKSTLLFSYIAKKYTISDLGKKEIIIILGRTTQEGEMPTDLQKYHTFLKEIEELYGERVLFKYHPREEDFYFGEKNDLSDLPAEIILLLGIDIKIILGLSSSIMYNAKYIDNNIISISLLDYFGFPEENINKLFKKEGIMLPKSIKQVEKLLTLKS